MTGGSYLPTGIGLLLFGLGAGLAMPAATDSIMGTLPTSRAGVGSAVNDTVRELGSALGVAVIGSVAATGYSGLLGDHLGRFTDLSGATRAALSDNVGAALGMSRQLGRSGAEIALLARDAFVESMRTALWLGVGVAVTATLVTLAFMPRPSRTVATADAGAGHDREERPAMS